MRSLFWKDEITRLEGAYAPATIKGYFTDIEIFVSWCAAQRVEPFPATPGLLAQFLQDQAASGLSMSTLNRRCYGIRKIHQLMRLPDPTRDEEVNLELRRIRRTKFARPTQAKGLTSDFLADFIAGQPDSPWGLRNRAMLSLGYDLLTRRSELVALRDTDMTARGDGTYRFVIRRSKADPFGKGRTAFCSRRSGNHLEAWLEWRGEATDWLFCPIYKQRPVDRGLSTTAVKELIKTAAKKAGFDEETVLAFSGHSLRVGAAQDLLRNGHDTAAIMRAGGWKSVEVLSRYLQDAEQNVWT